MSARAGHEDPARIVDPDLLDRRVVEVALQDSEAGDPGHQLLDDRVVVLDRRDDTGQAALVMLLDHPCGEPPDQARVALRVHPLGTDRGTDLTVERLEKVAVRIGICQAHGLPRSLVTLRSVWRPRWRISPFREHRTDLAPFGRACR